VAPSYGPKNRINIEAWTVDESKFDYTYVPEHLKERVKNWRNLSIGERLILTSEMSEAAWAKIGVVCDPSKPMDKTIRKFRRKENGELEPVDRC
jgi:hypothetical protein